VIKDYSATNEEKLANVAKIAKIEETVPLDAQEEELVNLAD
jgi:hypothetical protein